MKSRLPLIFFALAIGLSFCPLERAAVVFKPGQKLKYIPPGEEQMSSDAEELFHIGQKAEERGDIKRAIRAYVKLVRKHPRDALAAGSIFHAGELQEKTRDYAGAVISFRMIMEKYPGSPHFDEGIEGLFRIGEMYLEGKKLKLLGLPIVSPLDRAVEIFASVIRSAPYGKYTARAQFDIGLVREKQHLNDQALEAYQAVVDKFPNEPVAADAQYQIGYIWMKVAKSGTRDLAATKNARTAFGDFVFRYPNSEKAAQARENLKHLEQRQTASAFDVAKFYDKQKHYRAAVIYYNEVIREQPNSPESEEAKKRIDQLRAKVGDAALQVAGEAQGTKKTKTAAQQPGENTKPGRTGSPSPNDTEPLAPSDTGPLPPPDTDLSLPPPPSMSPGSGAEPASSPGPDTSSTPEEQPSPVP